MSDPLPFIDMLLKYIGMPLLAWQAYTHRNQTQQATQIAVLKAEAEAREKAREEDRKAMRVQLDQILQITQTVNSRMDALIMERQK